MDKNKIIERINKCLDDMYLESENVYGIDEHFTFADINEACHQVIVEEGIKELCAFVFSYFYIPKERHEELLKQAKKGIRHYWTWPRRTEMDNEGNIMPDKEWEEYYPQWCEMCDKRDKKEISRKEFNKWINEMAKKYGMVKRSKDAEAITFNVVNVSPTSNKSGLEELKSILNDIKGIPDQEIPAYVEKLNSETGKRYFSDDIIFCRKLGKKLENFKNNQNNH